MQLAAAPADTTRYAYDLSDHWTSASNAASVDTLKFDGAGRTVAEIVWRAGRRLVDSSYYNSLGLRSLVRWDMDSLAGYVTHGTAYGYDQSGQLDSLIPLPSGGLTSLGFNGDRLATTVTFPTGVVQSNTFSSIPGAPL